MTPEWEAAAKSGDANALSSLLADGADPNARDRYGQTALMLAAHAGHREAVEVLIAAGADLDRHAKHGLTATMLAVVGWHEAVARRLAAAGADLGVRGTGSFAGKSAADLARDRGLEDLATALEPGTPSE